MQVRKKPVLSPGQSTPQCAGSLKLASGWAHYHGPAGDTAFHKHYPFQLVFAQGQGAEVKFLDGRIATGTQITVASQTPHQLMPTQTPVDILYIEPALVCAKTKAFVTLDEWQAYLCCAPTRHTDPRIAAGIDFIEARLDQKISLEATARLAGMSKSSFTAKFRAATGLPLRRYVLWRRLLRAVVGISGGGSATEAAHQAGFADSAHFSRTMKETFGVSPSSSVLQIRLEILPDTLCRP